MPEKNIQIKKRENAEVEIEASIPWEEFEKYQKNAIARAMQKENVPGFRKGHAPENIVKDRIGKNALLEQAAESAIQDHYPKIIQDLKLDAIGKPHITVTKLAEQNNFEFTARTAVIPEFELPDYKSIAKNTPKETGALNVSEKEINAVLEDIRGKRGGQETDEHGKQKNPVLNDDFARSVGKFNTLAELQKSIKEGLLKEKEIKRKEKRRIAIIENILQKTDITVPLVLVESEKTRMLADLKYTIEQNNLDFNTYLAHIKKTEEVLKKEWSKTAENRAKTQLIMEKIAQTESLSIDEGQLEREANYILSLHPQANPEAARHYARDLLRYESVYTLLENQ